MSDDYYDLKCRTRFAMKCVDAAATGNLLTEGMIYSCRKSPNAIHLYVIDNEGREDLYRRSRFVEPDTVVTNTSRPGETPEQTEARTAPRLNASGEYQSPFGTDPVAPLKFQRAVLGTQVGGDHYTKHAIQPIEYIWANNLGFSEGNVVKYITRWKDKGGIKDLEKAKHHIELLIERETTRGVQGK